MRNRLPLKLLLPVAVLALIATFGRQGGWAEEKSQPKRQPAVPKSSPSAALTPPQWKQLDHAVDEGLKYLVTQQDPDGSFKCAPLGQPAITSLAVLAFLSRGHVPDQGPYGTQIHKAVDFVLSTQEPNGLLFGVPRRPRPWGIAGAYNHAISGIMLSEIYGMAGPPQQDAIRKAIEKALDFTRTRQRKVKSQPSFGGWRYLDEDYSADLSVTGWQLMFYRSAKNAEFDVPEQYMNEAVAYVERCYFEEKGTFSYGAHRPDLLSRGMAGAGVLSLSLAGKHDTKMAQRAAEYILDHPFDRFNRGGLTKEDRFYYGAYYCSQAMYQLGGKYWERFYPVLLKTMAENQNADGSWNLDSHPDDQAIGQVYTTSLAILSLTPPYQLLPIYQR